MVPLEITPCGAVFFYIKKGIGMKSELTNEMINSIEVLENLKDSFETPAIDYVINSIKEAIKSMGERANYVNDSYLYNLNRTRIVLRILIDVNSFNKNDEEFNQNFNEVIEILNNEIEKEKENENFKSDVCSCCCVKLSWLCSNIKFR